MRKSPVYAVSGGIRVVFLVPNVFAAVDISFQISNGGLT